METDKGCGARNFSEFDSMTTEQLQDILRVDLLIPDEESDAELILHIVEVIAEREAHIPYPGTSSPEASWERFKARHLSDPDRPGEPEPQPNTCSVIQPGRRRAARRAASIAAIFAGVIILGSAGAYAAGIDIFQAIANWTQDTFYFAGTGGTGITIGSDVPPQLRGLAAELKRYGVEEKVIPGYLPEGYELDDENFYLNNDYMVFRVRLNNGEKAIGLSYLLYLHTANFGDIEKDIGNPELIEQNGITYCIFTNTKDTVLTWVNGKLECTITGLPAEEMHKVIESIK